MLFATVAAAATMLLSLQMASGSVVLSSFREGAEIPSSLTWTIKKKFLVRQVQAAGKFVSSSFFKAKSVMSCAASCNVDGDCHGYSIERAKELEENLVCGLLSQGGGGGGEGFVGKAFVKGTYKHFQCGEKQNMYFS